MGIEDEEGSKDLIEISNPQSTDNAKDSDSDSSSDESLSSSSSEQSTKNEEPKEISVLPPSFLPSSVPTNPGEPFVMETGTRTVQQEEISPIPPELVGPPQYSIVMEEPGPQRVVFAKGVDFSIDADPAPTSWPCSKCGFSNSLDRTKCKQCNHKRSKKYKHHHHGTRREKKYKREEDCCHCSSSNNYLGANDVNCCYCCTPTWHQSLDPNHSPTATCECMAYLCDPLCNTFHHFFNFWGNCLDGLFKCDCNCISDGTGGCECGGLTCCEGCGNCGGCDLGCDSCSGCNCDCGGCDCGGCDCGGCDCNC
eukprot:TRINITY_DN1781_c0_g1_i1.p1 TRINITY_DN1781_c0_g1~~TRINITY_DN1781_c0_g1_i1.p1  ORF type:complete len:309 (-),score=54.61 TRINITY_DN1781_c0_g1_i1:27-953(-)